ncbi:DNA repair and recombination protein RadB [Candidatus Woesearchaeota archaeon]|nr:DNA repair and recombination protein RadB [Candidatus Woesearchaeota archaeon]
MKEEIKVSSGSPVVDKLLEGGFETGVLNTVYGPAGSGKTCCCLIAAILQSMEGRKTVYIDTESNFSLTRLKQLADDYKRVLNNMLFSRPGSMAEQKKSLLKLKESPVKNLGLIIIDSIATPYRVEMGMTKEKYDVNRELGFQLSILLDIARARNIPVLLTDQVYSDFENKGTVKIVGGDVISYSSKCLVELKKFAGGKRAAIVKRHRSLPEGKSIMLEITEKGFQEVY